MSNKTEKGNPMVTAVMIGTWFVSSIILVTAEVKFIHALICVILLTGLSGFIADKLTHKEEEENENKNS